MAGGRSQNQIWNLDGELWFRTWRLVWRSFSSIRPRKAFRSSRPKPATTPPSSAAPANGLIQMTTRSGTNAFHGAAYEFFRNQVLDTRTFFAAQKAPLRYNIFGASFGGPVLQATDLFLRKL